jgi:hypothetical protein
MTLSQIPPEKIESYRQALYRVEALEGTFLLKVDVPSPELKALLELHQAPCAAYVTAYNPDGRLAPQKENHKRQQELEADLNPWVLFPGAGEDPEGKWPPEPSFLVLGIPLEKAKVLGNKYRQNAILWADADGVPKLELLR